MNMRQLLIVGLAITTLVAAFVMTDSSESSSEDEYLVYYLIDDDRLGEDQYSIDFNDVFVTDTYVFFRTVLGNENTKIASLPSTENIVSRYYSTNLADDGYVLNPDGTVVGLETVYDKSGWFTDDTYLNRATSESTLGELDDDHDKIIFLHMRAAKTYEVTYHLRNYDGNKWTDLMFYDGHYIEQAYPAKYNQNRFGEVDYIVKLVEGMPIGSNLPTTDNVYCENYSASIQFYLPLSSWAKGDGSYSMDVHSKNGHEFSWVLRNGQTGAINVESSTPVYEGLTVTDELDPNGDGVIELYGTTTRTSGENAKFYITAGYSLEGTSLVYMDSVVNNTGHIEEVTYSEAAGINGNRRTITDYELELPEYEGFIYSGTFSKTSSITSCTVEYDGVRGHYYATISGSCSKDDAIYAGTITFEYVRETVDISVVIGDSTTVKTVGYGCTLVLDPPIYADHQFYRWNTVGLNDSLQPVENTYQYVVTQADLSDGAHTITAEWQNGSTHPVYTVEYVSRVNDVHIVSSVVDNNGSLTLPMIQKEGYSHMGWALVNPDLDIDYDTTALVIYPGRTSFTPSAVSSQYKTVDPENSNLVTIRLYAIWCTTYTIHFDANGGTGSMDDEGPIMVIEHFTLPRNTFTKNNVSFIGWSTVQGGSVQYADRASVISLSADVEGYVTLYAVWSEAEYVNVIYDKNNGMTPDGQSMRSQKVELEGGVGSVHLNNNIFYRTGYDFYGWATSFERSAYSPDMQKVGNVIYLSDEPIGYIDGATIEELSNSLSLFAIWKPHTYTIVFDANGGYLEDGEEMSPQSFTYGVSQSLSANKFKKGGYAFGGWVDGSGNSYTNGYLALNLTSEDNATITLYAVWTCYYVNFHAQNGTGNYDTHTAYTGVAFNIPEIMFTYIGHIFVGWNTSPDGSGTSYSPGSSILNMAPDGQTQDLYAIWSVYEYTIAFDSNGGSGSMASMEASGGSQIVLRTNTFTYTDRDFLGWSMDRNATVPEFLDGQTVTDIGTGVNGETVTLYAIWSNQNIIITISGLKSSNGSNISDKTAIEAFIDLQHTRVGDTILLKLNNNYVDQYTQGRRTYYLVGWEYTLNGDHTVSYGSSLNLTQSITLTAVYEQYKDTIRYHINFPGESDSYVDLYIGLTRSGNWSYTYSGETEISDSLFNVNEYPILEGYRFCVWSTSQNSVTAAKAPGDVYSITNASSANQTINLWAVWVKIEIDDGVYTGSYVTPDYVITAYYGTGSEELTPSKTEYSNYIHAGTATVNFTMPVEYKSVVISTEYTIHPAQVTVTVDSGIEKYYGVAEDPALTGTVECDVSQQQMTLDDFEVVYSRIAGEDAGNYLISASARTPNSDYEITCHTNTMRILPAVVTIVMHDASKGYGEADPSFEATVTCTTASVDVLSISYYRTNAGTEEIGVYEGVISATYTPNGNYDVRITAGTFTIDAAQTVTFIILDGRGGGETYEEGQSAGQGGQFASKTVTANSGYAFREWVRAVYDGNTVIALIHITYSNTLDSADISAGETYIAMFTTGDGIVFNANGGTGSMEMQEFGDSSGTLTENSFEKDGYVFLGWSLTFDGPVKYTDRAPLFRMSGLSTTDNQNVLYAVWAPYTYTSAIDWNISNEPEPQQMMMNNADYSIDADDIVVEAVITDREDLGLIMKIGAVSFAMICAAGAALYISRRR